MDEDLQSIADARESARRARRAFEVYRRFSQDDVDRITYAVVEAGYAAAESLAKLAVEETGIGRVVSKTAKNRFGTRGLWQAIRGLRTVGIINEDPDRRLLEVADPFGVVAAIIPTTNPTSTALYKSIICLKSRNAMVASPHPRAVGCVVESIRIAEAAAVAAGAPPGILTCMSKVTIEGTQALMKDDAVDLILATGGSALVRQAYSSGKPAFGVGPGNVPVYIDRSADVVHAARCIVESQTFDNSTLCTSEQSLICDAPVAEAFVAALCSFDVHICSPAETGLLERLVIRNGVTNTEIVGLDAPKVAALAGFSVPAKTTVLVAPYDKVGKAHPLSREKLCPILALYVVDGWEAGCHRCIELLNVGGRGHTLGIHCEEVSVIRAFALEKPVNRIVVNSPTAQGGVGFTTDLFPSMTLGCGSFGGNITSDNIGPQHLLNIKRVAWVKPAYRAGTMPDTFDHLPPLAAGVTRPGPAVLAWSSRPLGLLEPRDPAGENEARNPAALKPRGRPMPRELEAVIEDSLRKRRQDGCPIAGRKEGGC